MTGQGGVVRCHNCKTVPRADTIAVPVHTCTAGFPRLRISCRYDSCKGNLPARPVLRILTPLFYTCLTASRRQARTVRCLNCISVPLEDTTRVHDITCKISAFCARIKEYRYVSRPLFLSLICFRNIRFMCVCLV